MIDDGESFMKKQRIRKNEFKRPSKIKELNDQFQDDFLKFMDHLDHVEMMSMKTIDLFTPCTIHAWVYFQEEKGRSCAADVTHKDIIDFLASEKRTRSMYAMYLKTLKKMVAWGYHSGFYDQDMVQKIAYLKLPKLETGSKPLVIPLSDDELRQIVENIEARFPYDPLVVDKFRRGLNTNDLKLRKSLMCVQLKTLMILLLETGGRMGEVWHLNANDVDPVNETILFNKGTKNGKVREVPYSELLRKQMRMWLAHRALIIKPGDDCLWLSMYFNRVGSPSESDPRYIHITKGSFNNWKKFFFTHPDAGANARTIRNHVGKWHRFRKTFATKCWETGLDIGVISKLLGHGSTLVTMRYIGIDTEMVKKEAAAIEKQRASMYEKAIPFIQGGQVLPSSPEYSMNVLPFSIKKEKGDNDENISQEEERDQHSGGGSIA